MKVAIFSILFAVVICVPLELQQSFLQNNSLEFLKGFIEGVGAKENIEELLKCIEETESIFEKIKEALEHLKHLDIKELEKGFKMLLEAMKELFEMLKPCSESTSVIDKLLKAILSANIFKIVARIMANPVDFIRDVKQAIVCFAKNDYYCAGRNIGDIMRLVFFTRGEKL